MLDGLFQLLINLFLYLAQLLSSIIVQPIYGLLSNLFPELSSYNDFISDFMDKFTYGINYACHVFVNVTGFPVSFLQALISIFLARIAFAVALRSIIFIMNVYGLIKSRSYFYFC